MSRYLVRPIANSDLTGLEKLLSTLAHSLTTLPKDPNLLQSRIDKSLRSFDPSIKQAGDEYYLFVLEDTKESKLVGTSAIRARIGGFEPFYTYKIKEEAVAHPPLQIDKSIEVLHLKKTHKGPSELCSLFLHPDYRKSGLGRLLSLSRFLFMHSHPERFETNVIAELRGYLDESGKSPFWESVGQHFFETDFDTADFISGLEDKTFIEHLMPKYPIYKILLPQSVQSVIGRVHKNTEPALHLLQAQGFSISDEVDIFDAGPLLEAPIDQIKAVQEAKNVALSRNPLSSKEPKEFLIANCSIDFRACIGPVSFENKTKGQLYDSTATTLQLKPNKPFCITPLR